MNKFVLKNILIKIYIYHFLIYLYKNKKSKLDFKDRVVVLNNLKSFNVVVFSQLTINTNREEDMADNGTRGGRTCTLLLPWPTD
jgi:hypothetical protein